MSDRIVLLVTLKDKRDHQAYEAFVRQAVLPLVQEFASVRSYDVISIHRLMEGGGDTFADFIEVVEVTGTSDYERDLTAMLATESGQEFERRWAAFVGAFTSLQGEAVR